MLPGLTCVNYQPLLVGMHNDNYNQRVPKHLVLVKVIGKGRTNIRRVDVLNPLISPIDLTEDFLIVGAMDIYSNSSLGQQRKLPPWILGLRQNRNCLRQNSSKELRSALALIVVSKVISLRHVQSQKPS